MRLKSQYKETKEQLRTKEYELEEIKRNMKFTRMHEHEIEVKTLQEEIDSLRRLYENSAALNKKNEKVIEELENYKELYLKYKKANEQNEMIISNYKKIIASKDEELRKFSSLRKTNYEGLTTANVTVRTDKDKNPKSASSAKLQDKSNLNPEASKKVLNEKTHTTSISTISEGLKNNFYEPSIHDYIDKINSLKDLVRYFKLI